MTKEQQKKIKELREQGYSLRDIAKEVGVKSPNTISYWLTKMKIEGITAATMSGKLFGRIKELEVENRELKGRIKKIKKFVKEI